MSGPLYISTPYNITGVSKLPKIHSHRFDDDARSRYNLMKDKMNAEMKAFSYSKTYVKPNEFVISEPVPIQNVN